MIAIFGQVGALGLHTGRSKGAGSRMSSRRLSGTGGKHCGERPKAGHELAGAEGRRGIRYKSLERNQCSTTIGLHREVSRKAHGRAAVGSLGCFFLWSRPFRAHHIWGAILDLQKSCRDNTESSCMLFT